MGADTGEPLELVVDAQDVRTDNTSIRHKDLQPKDFISKLLKRDSDIEDNEYITKKRTGGG